MKILVSVKRVVDFNVKVRTKADGSGVDIANAKMSMNPFDEIGVEEGVRLREAGVATEVVAVSCGLAQCQETLRTALAIGADRAILVQTDEELGQATFASKLTLADGWAQVTREVDGGLETVSVKLPAVVTTDLRLNEPRYVTLPNIMKAKKKPLETLTPKDLGVDASPRLKTLRTVEPPQRKAGIRVPDVATLVQKLRDEAKVIS